MDIDQELKEFQYSDKGPILSELTFTHEMKNHVREKMIMTSKPKRRIWYWTTSIAGFLIILLAITGMPSADTIKNLFPTLTNTPRISAFVAYGDEELKAFHEKGLTVPYHVSKTDQGVTVTITDLFFDGHLLAIGYLVQMPPEKDLNRDLFSDYLADFKELTLNGNGESFLNGGSTDVTRIGDHLYAGINSAYLKEGAPNDFKLHAQIERVGLVGGSGKWQWDLEFKMPDSLKALQRTVPPHFEKDRNGLQFKAENIRRNATGTTLQLKVKGPKEKLENLLLSFYDQYMTELSFSSNYGYLNENTLEHLLSLSYLNGEDPFIYMDPRVLAKKDPELEKSKTNKNPPKDAEIDLSQPLPYVLSEQQGDFILKKVDFLSTKTVIHYEVKNPFNQKPLLTIKDEKENEYKSLPEKDAKREFTDSYSFIEEFPPFPSPKNLKLVVPTDVMNKEEQKIREQNLIKIPLL
ncbi:DUF4179 domain-containing protein [Brevibacillus laterosporus]|uniref:DUF4179 domain-containing protein n=1 Tax=Brevibacillus halotolerans TaxID=1507437 RepID=A0ABT4HYJ2_9BACL|nr:MULTISPECIES: DUF4179 domain-containing protein [Brevibacillus]MCR8985843.1 DUF4179 domain-containing protein [Brevibacillus laterosporus]MCZ0831576.1 DUF4179 domain-containing protein [Brevibacillus halotolerans]